MEGGGGDVCVGVLGESACGAKLCEKGVDEGGVAWDSGGGGISDGDEREGGEGLHRSARRRGA